jgi:ParB-like chromosome segregation protein Spo0J
MELAIEYLSVDALKPYENNPRRNDDAVEYVANSIREFGFKVPIVIDRDNVIVAGHTRLKAAKLLGLDEVPVIVADDLTPEQVKAFRLADNKTGELAEWDFELLDIELGDISDIDMSLFGFGDIEEFEVQEESKGSMADKYLVPPFSVIYANKQDWLARKRAWVEKGIRSEIGRGGTCLQFKEQSGGKLPTQIGGGQ